jgi:PEP-utilising enzyme, PEP-binding domain
VNDLEVYAMAEIPANAILVDEFAALFDGFSIGSNDLTRLVLGVDRDSELVAPEFDERNPAVLSMIGMIIDGAQRAGRKVEICSQAPSDYSDMVRFLVDKGITSISLNPDAVVRGPRGRRGRAGRPAQNGLTRNRARRFWAQHASLCAMQTGRSLPYEIATIRSAGIPRSIRWFLAAAARRSPRLRL